MGRVTAFLAGITSWSDSNPEGRIRYWVSDEEDVDRVYPELGWYIITPIYRYLRTNFLTYRESQ